MKALKKIVFFGILLPVLVNAQYNDFGIWQGITLQKSISSKWQVELNERLRFNENATVLNYVKSNLGLAYKVNNFLSLSLNYAYIYRTYNSDENDARHRYFVAAMLKKKWTNLSLAYRAILQMQFSNFLSRENGMIPSFVDRNRFTLKYSGLWVSPYLATEIYLPLNGKQAFLFNRTRYFAGLFYEINKVQELEFYLLYENNYNTVNPPQRFVVGFCYSHNFY